MKLSARLSVFSYLIPIILACCIVTISVIVIDSSLYRLNIRLLTQEIITIHHVLELKYQVLKRAGVANLPNYIDQVKEEILTMLKSNQFELTGQAFIVTRRGLAVYYPKFMSDEKEPFQFPAVIYRSAAGDTELTFAGQDYVSLFKASDAFDWVVGQSIEKSQMLTERNEYLKIFSGVALLILCASLFLSSRLLYHLTEAIDAMLGSVKRVSNGDFTTRIATETFSKELANLSRGINAMTENLQNQTKMLKESEERYRAFIANSIDGIYHYELRPAMPSSYFKTMY